MTGPILPIIGALPLSLRTRKIRFERAPSGVDVRWSHKGPPVDCARDAEHAWHRAADPFGPLLAFRDVGVRECACEGEEAADSARTPSALFKAVNRRDVWMVEGGEDLGFALETGNAVRIRGKLRGENL